MAMSLLHRSCIARGSGAYRVRLLAMVLVKVGVVTVTVRMEMRGRKTFDERDILSMVNSNLT